RRATRRPLVTVALSLVLAALSLTYTLHAIGFVTSSLRLLPQHARYVVLLREYLKDFGELNDILVAVEAPPDQARQFAARLAEQLRQDGLGARVTYRVDPAYFKGRALLYLSVADLTTLRPSATACTTMRPSSPPTRPAPPWTNFSRASTVKSPAAWSGACSTSAWKASRRPTFTSSRLCSSRWASGSTALPHTPRPGPPR